MKNNTLLAIAFAFLLLGQTGAVEQRNPQDAPNMRAKEKATEYLKSKTDQGDSVHKIAQDLAEAMSVNPEVCGELYRDIQELVKSDKLAEAVIAKAVKDEFLKCFSLIYFQPCYQKKHSDALEKLRTAEQDVDNKSEKIKELADKSSNIVNRFKYETDLTKQDAIKKEYAKEIQLQKNTLIFGLNQARMELAVAIKNSDLTLKELLISLWNMNQKIIALQDQTTKNISEEERAEKERDIQIFKAAINYSGNASFLEPDKRAQPQARSKEKEEKASKIIYAKTLGDRDNYIRYFFAFLRKL